MEPSLSVLLPVENAESTLASTVNRILEVLPELTRHFEISVIDDGSTDATIEVADELVSRYPQVRVVRHSKPLGRTAAIQTGMKHSTGEILFLADEHCRLPLSDLRRLWEAIPGQEIVLAKPPSPDQSNRPDRVGSSGSQMLRRGTAERFRDSLRDQAALRRKLAQTGCSWHEVPVGATEKSAQSDPIKSDTVKSGPKRPIYLDSLKKFASGE